MTIKQAIEIVDEQYGIFSQCVIADIGTDWLILAPKNDDCLYDNRDFEFLQSKVVALLS